MDRVSFYLCDQAAKNLEPIWATMDSERRKTGMVGGIICDIRRDSNRVKVEYLPTVAFRRLQDFIKNELKLAEFP